MNIEEKKTVVTEKVKDLLKNSDITYSYISSIYNEAAIHRDGTERALIVTIAVDSLLDRMSQVYTDPDTLELLYVQTGPASFVDIDTFFSTEEDD